MHIPLHYITLTIGIHVAVVGSWRPIALVAEIPELEFLTGLWARQVADSAPVLPARGAPGRLVRAAPLIGALTGLVSATYPALRAAYLEPVDALRST